MTNKQLQTIGILSRTDHKHKSMKLIQPVQMNIYESITFWKDLLKVSFLKVSTLFPGKVFTHPHPHLAGRTTPKTQSPSRHTSNSISVHLFLDAEL